jgi:predicted ATPase
MITRLTVANYRSIGEAELHLGPLTVLVGPNGVGKSNLLDAIHFLSDALTLGLDAAVTRRHGIKRLRRWSPSKPRNVMMEVEIRGNSPTYARYRLVLKSERDGNYTVQSEELDCETAEGTPYWLRAKGGVAKTSDDENLGPRGADALWVPLRPSFEAHLFVSQMQRMGFYSIFPNALRDPQSPDVDFPLETHGRNLTAVLRRIDRAGPEARAQIVAALTRLVPAIHNVRVRPVGSHLVVEFSHTNGVGSGHWLDSSQESDGTLRMLGVLTALYQTPSPALVGIEEPELTIHPGMLATLRDAIVEASEKRTQVIVTTHSPDLMSLFDVDCLRVAEMTPEGTKVGPVASSQRAVIRDELFSPGELARSEGLRRDDGGQAGART